MSDRSRDDLRHDRLVASTDIWGSQYASGAWSTSQPLSDDPGAAAQANLTVAYSTAEVALAWRDDRAGNADIRGRQVAFGPAADHFGYSYDGLERLTAGTTTNPESFTLDAASNIASRTGPAATYSYDTANRLTNDGTQTFTWNTADRLTTRGADTFGYDPLDRMTSSTVSATARTYTYNGDGLLKSRTQGASTTQFLWDPSSSPSRLLIQGSDKLVYGLGPLWVVKADGTTSSFARDGGKSVRAEVNGSGTVTASFRYRAYGAIAQSSGASMPSYLGYAGQLQDPSGLLYMRARWYDPATGRFLTRDPLDAAITNAFGYANANPALLSDPSGLMATIDDGGCGDLCPGDDTGPVQLGLEWLSGTGPREHHFVDNDPFAEMVRKSDHVQDLIRGVESGAMGPSGSFDYDLGGVEGVGKYARDYSTVLTGGATGNLAVTYLGSYKLDYSVSHGILEIQISNSSTIASATHPPVIGYTGWWQSAVGDRLNATFATGPMSATTQTIVLHELLHR